MIGAMLAAAYRLSMLKRLVESSWVQDRWMYLRPYWATLSPATRRTVAVVAGLVLLWVLFA